MQQKLYCGVEIGGTKIQCAVGTARGEIVERVRFDQMFGVSRQRFSHCRPGSVVQPRLSELAVSPLLLRDTRQQGL